MRWGVVSDNIVEGMANEKDYTPKWWLYAKNLFYLWKEEKTSLTKATESINNNQFLFDDEYCSEKLKNSLIELEIFYRWIESYQTEDLTQEERQIVKYLRNHPDRVEEILKRIKAEK